jgi:hypothetical protein
MSAARGNRKRDGRPRGRPPHKASRPASRAKKTVPGPEPTPQQPSRPLISPGHPFQGQVRFYDQLSAQIYD